MKNQTFKKKKTNVDADVLIAYLINRQNTVSVSVSSLSFSSDNACCDFGCVCLHSIRLHTLQQGVVYMCCLIEQRKRGGAGAGSSFSLALLCAHSPPCVYNLHMFNIVLTYFRTSAVRDSTESDDKNEFAYLVITISLHVFSDVAVSIFV